MKVFRARAPLRLGLAGGGTDVSPYCDIHGGYVLNATIDRYAYAEIRIINSNKVQFNASDLNIECIELAQKEINLNGELQLHRMVYHFMINNYNNGIPISLRLTTYCDAPAGSGLGSSSTLVVVMVKAFSEMLKLNLDEYSIAQIAYRIERIECKLLGGKQDQYAASFGGINFMEFYDQDRVVINSLRIKNWILCELESSLLLYFTGVSRDSDKIISDQSNNVKQGLINTIDAMHCLKEQAIVMKESLIKGDFKNIIDSMRIGWLNKRISSGSVSNSNIDSIFNTAMGAGALAGKVSGAGGGGFMWFFVPIEKRSNVIKELSQFHGQVNNCHFTKNGVESWTTE